MKTWIYFWTCCRTFNASFAESIGLTVNFVGNKLHSRREYVLFVSFGD